MKSPSIPLDLIIEHERWLETDGRYLRGPGHTPMMHWRDWSPDPEEGWKRPGALDEKDFDRTGQLRAREHLRWLQHGFGEAWRRHRDPYPQSPEIDRRLAAARSRIVKDD